VAANGEDDGPVVAFQVKETERLVWRAVERLPRLWAIAIILHYHEEKCLADIAKIMDTRENTVKTYLFRGRQKLRHMLAGLVEDDDAHRRTE
jgi:RNA polymerase sigma-70 factor (ECF subfamily)